MPLSRFFPCFQFRLEDNVQKLDYSNIILSEAFPDVWQHERTLEELNVTSTRISYLPPQLFYCQGLKVFLASCNSLESIPEAIGTLRQLQLLNLSRNFISNVPDNIKSCKNLTYLDLSCNSLRKLPDAITCLISLQELILNETYLEYLPANFGRLVNLRIVELRSNNLVSLPKSMQRLTNLQRLDIGCNEFLKMPEVIGELKQLRELWFDFNQIQCVPLQIGKLRDLVHFESNGNCLSFLPNEIGNWINVEVISLSINNLITLPSSVGMLKSLVTLKCESNELSELPATISNLENLEELVVSHNRLTSLPNTIGMLRKLRYLFADDNILQNIPDEICSCTALSIVSVSKNNLTALPDNLGHLTNLKVLNIVQNNIETLPVSLLSLVNLTSLWISNNQSQPLIPLQYTEILNKTQLTCFMLPQLGIKQNENHINTLIVKESNEFSQTEPFSPKTATYSISKRRICFAEEATILHTDPQKPHLLMQCSQNGNYFEPSNKSNSVPRSLADLCANTEILDENRKDYLMRSPTPHPKELRLMAKYVQLNQQKSLNSSSNHNSNYQMPTVSQKFQNDDQQDERFFICNSFTLHTTVDANIKGEGKLYGVCGKSEDNLEYFPEEKLNQNTDIDRSETIYNEHEYYSNQQLDIAHNSAKPPPYHIARCFTKKSVVDLSKYEFTRKLQEHHHQFQTSETLIGKQTFSQISNNLSEIELAPNNNINKEIQYNLLDQHFEPRDELKRCNTLYEGSDNSETVITVGQTICSNSKDSPEDLNKLTTRKLNKTRTKWLFGAHKNPRVMQVNLNLQNVRDFEIDVLPNKEGIFVVSTASHSNVSQLVHPLDKLLEVDGIDFTNISLKEARHVLQNSRPSISIMLSRK